MKIPKDTLLIILILFFLSIAISSFLIIKFNNKPRNPKVFTNKDYKPGIFSINGPNQVNVNIPFKLKFIANSQNQTVNAVALEIVFDANKIEVLNVDTSQSFCQFYPQNRFNNNKGTVSIQCGAPHPGFRGENTIAEITFLPKSLVQTEIKITDKSLILISDGKGSNIFSQAVNHNLSILNNIWIDCIFPAIQP